MEKDIVIYEIEEHNEIPIMIESPHSFVQVAVVSPLPQFPSSLGVLLVLHSAPE